MAVALHELVTPFLEIEQRQQFAGSVLDLRPVLVIQARDEAKKLRTGELLINEGTVGDEPELALRGDRLRGQIDAADVHCPGRRPQNAGDHAKRGRLAGAVRPQKAEQLSTWYGQVDVVDGREAAVALGQRAKLDHARLPARRCGENVDLQVAHQSQQLRLACDAADHEPDVSRVGGKLAERRIDGDPVPQ
jgi:hypothetical protein